jgi:hypothetical protein
MIMEEKHWAILNTCNNNIQICMGCMSHRLSVVIAETMSREIALLSLSTSVMYVKIGIGRAFVVLLRPLAIVL